MSQATLQWPKKRDVLGVQVSATTYDETVARVLEAARRRIAAVVSCHAVHAIISASTDRSLLGKVNSFQIVAPDGQPVRWALNRLYGMALHDRVYGPELMHRLCRCAAREGISVYLHGSTPDVILELKKNLIMDCPGLVIAGAESPPFRPLSNQETDEMVQRINASGAGIVFVGLGCPKQDHFAFDHSGRIQAVQVCVGAAFDFHAGVKPMAPLWMQRRGMEWLFRLCQEPQRLWRRYLTTNLLFIQKLMLQWGSLRLSPNGK